MEPQGPPKGNVVVVLDFENIHATAQRDSGLKLAKGGDLVALIVSQIMTRVESRYGQVVGAYAAMGVPSLSKGAQSHISRYRDNLQRLRKSSLDVVARLSDLGFTVGVVQAGPDAADYVLCAFGEQAAQQSEVETIVLCTDDGGDHFLKLFDVATKVGKEAVLFAYDHPAESFRNAGISIELIGSDIRLAAEVGSTVTAIKQPMIGLSGQKKSEEIPIEPSLKERYNQAIRSIKNEKINPPTREIFYVIAVIQVLQDELTRSDRRFGLSRSVLISTLQRRLKHIEPEEVKHILFTIFEKTDLLEDNPRFFWRETGKSTFWQASHDLVVDTPFSGSGSC